MAQDENRTPAKYRGGKITSGFVITAVTLLIFVLLMLVLMKLEVVPAPVFLNSVFRFGNAESSEQNEETAGSKIPDFSAGSVLAGEAYYSFSVDPRETLASLTARDSYVREFRVVNLYGSEADLRNYTLTVKGDCYRLESEKKTVICDGTSSWTLTGTYRTQLNDTVFTPEYEVGITSLADVKSAAEKGSVTRHATDDKMLLVVWEDAESGILSEYTVSIETGVVMSERSYIGGELYRAVDTDLLDIFAAEDLPAEYFAIPQEP